jgi:GNAT superfamily N-acetyltransferase
MVAIAEQPVIRPAAAAEAPILSALALRSKGYWGYDRAFMAACVTELTVTGEDIEQQPVNVAEVQGEIIGFYMLAPLSAHEVELGFLFVEPACIGRGYGRRLMRHAIETAHRSGFRTMVIQGDPNADGFYRSMGAVPVGTRPSDSIPDRLLPLYERDLGLREEA